MRGSRCWATALVQFLLVSIQLPTTCLAHDSVQVVTASVITPGQPSSTITAPAQTHTIQVGLADHKFRPEATMANVGDTVEFAFYPLNHSVVRAEYGFPCIPYEMTGASKIGFFSDFHPVDTVLSSPPTYRIVINDTDPIFFYCSAPGSCINYGMVGAINPNASASVQEQQQLALDSMYMLNPGEPFPAETLSPSNPPTSTPTSSPVPENTASTKSRLSTRAIIAMSVTSASITILAALLFFFWGRTKSLKEEIKRKAGLSHRPSTSPSGGETRMLESRAELGSSSSSDNNNLPHPQQYFMQHHHHPHQHLPTPTPDITSPYHQQYQQSYPASLSQIPLYFPPPHAPTSSPSPLPTPPPPPSSHSHPHIHPAFLPPPGPQPTPSKYNTPSPPPIAVGQHPAHLPVEYYAQQQQHQQVQVRHELSPTGDSQARRANVDAIAPAKQEPEGPALKTESRAQCTGRAAGDAARGDKDVPGYFDAVFAKQMTRGRAESGE
ncbi:hypothetical protein PSV08DRAFT_249712 [Bipolaris maydis]|nr:hypothetical protein PSV08DRAFT_249712 [Bipolaris maydis]